MTDGIRLSRFALPVVEAAAKFIRRSSAQAVTGTPKVCGARLVSYVAQHPANFPVLNLPKSLPAKLEVVALLIDRIAAIAIDQNSSIHTGD